MKPRYIIYAPAYSQNNGGAIVMHRLCHTLNELGETAVIYPWHGGIWGTRSQRLKKWLFPKPYVTNPELNTPVMRIRWPRKTDIAVYSEMTGNNPMGARNVCYWLLDRPSYRGRKVENGGGALFFAYDHRCDDPELTGGTAQILFLFQANKIYRQTNFGPRKGSCYLVRKGKGQPMVHDLADSVMIDGNTHDQINAIFNETEIFYSYDEMSSYSQFAALCGCTSVVVPWHYKDQAEFIEAYPLSRFGVAYGVENIPHAQATRHMVADYLRQCEEDGVQSVRDFVTRTRAHFGFPARA